MTTELVKLSESENNLKYPRSILAAARYIVIDANAKAAEAALRDKLKAKREAQEKEKMENELDFSDLIEDRPQATKKCAYTTCENQIPANAEKNLCEKCRAFAARNAIALRLDPVTPMAFDRIGCVEHTLLTNMTGEEILRYAKNLEEHYLEVQKVIKLHKLEKDSPRTLKTYEEQINEARSAVEAVSVRAKIQKKSAKIKETRMQRLVRTLGCSEKEAKRIMDDDFGDL